MQEPQCKSKASVTGRGGHDLGVTLTVASIAWTIFMFAIAGVGERLNGLRSDARTPPEDIYEDMDASVKVSVDAEA